MTSSTSLYTTSNTTSNVSGSNFTTLYSGGGGVAPVPGTGYGNANVESFLAVGTDSGGNTVGNITSSGAISATGNITTDQYFIGTFLGNIAGNLVVPGFNTQVLYNNNGNAGASSGLTFVAASNTLTSSGVVSAVGNIQGGNLNTTGKISATGNITTAGNVAATYFLGNGSQLTGLPEVYGNANVAAYLPTYTGAMTAMTGNVTTTANITGSYILGNGSQLTGLPATYSNANVTTLLANFGSNVISTTGNVTAGYFVGNGSTLTNLTAGNIVGTVANAAYALNANAATYATTAINATQANYANIANSVAGANVSGVVPLAQYVTQAAQANITSLGVLTSVSSTGNITGANINGNGSGLSSITGANVSGTVANATYALNSNSAVYSTNATQANYANIANSVAGANVSGTVANATYALNSNSASYANHANVADLANSVAGANVTGTVPLAQYVTQAAQGNITSVGTLTSLSVSGNTTSGNISAIGNISGSNLNIANNAVILGNLTVNGNATFFNSNVVTINDKFINLANNASTPAAANGGGIGIGPIASEYATLTFNSTTNIWESNIGFGITGNVTGSNILTPGLMSATGNVIGGNIVTAGQISATGNATAGNISTGGIITAVGNITGGNIIGNGQYLTNITAANITGTVGLAQYVTANAQANITSVGTLTSLSVSGNVDAGNLQTVGNIGSTQQTIIGTANATASATGNIVISGKNIATDVVFSPDVSTTSEPTGGRILIGSGVAGNISLLTYDNNNALRGVRLAQMDAFTKNNSSVVSGGIKSWQAITLDGNITAATSRMQGIGAILNVGGGAAGNTYLPSHNLGVTTNGLNGLMTIVNLGGATANLISQIGGNLQTAYATGTSSLINFYGANSYTGNAVGFMSTFLTNNATSNIRNAIGYSINAGDQAGNTTAVGNTIGYLFPDYVSSAGAAVGGSFTKGNLYAFFNAGNVAQMRLGSIREQHYLAYSPTPVAGNVTIDAANGMYQTITPTSNIAITDFLNFVTGGYNVGLNTTVPQYQEVTLCVAQGATPYTVTLPTTLASTGNPVQYENNFSSVNATALAMTYITIKAQPTGVAGGFPWYVSVRQGGTSAAQGAAGANTWVQFNDGNVLGANGNFNYNKATNLLTAGNVNVYQSTGNVWGVINAGNVSTIGSSSVIYSEGNITAFNTASANIISATTYVTTPALYTSDLTPPGGGPLLTTTSLSTISGNLSVTGNIQGGNLRTAGSISATGNITGGNLIGTLITSSISISGNITAGNISTTGISTLGSLKTYNEAQYTLATTGTVNIDKNNAQVQYLAPTANVTIGSLQNFVTTQSSVNQADTVTLIIKQGATPYTITLPTGNAAIKYAGNVTTVGTTANAVTMVAITGANISGAATYLVTVSPEFV